MIWRHGTRLAVAMAIEGAAVALWAWRAEKVTDRLEARARDLSAVC